MSELDDIISSAEYWLEPMRHDEPEPSQVVELVARLAREMKRRLDPPDGCVCREVGRGGGNVFWQCPVHGSCGGARTAFC